MTLTEALDLFIADVCAGKRNDTPAAYREKASAVIKVLGNRDTSSLTRDDILKVCRAYLEREQKVIGHKTVKAHLSVFTIRSVFRMIRYFTSWLYQHGMTADDLSLLVKLPNEPQVVPKAIRPETVKRLVEAAARQGEIWERARNLAIIYLMRDTGIRLGALLSATVDGLDFDRRTLTVTDKGGHQYTLQLLPVVCQLLRQWLDWRAKLSPADNHLFISIHKTKGHAMTRRGFYNMLRRVANQAGLPKGERYNPHSFRHAFARDVLRESCDITRLSRLLGHSTPTTTMKWYAVWDDQELRETHDQVSPALALGTPPSIE